MKRPIALVVISALLMQLNGCAVYKTYRLRPSDTQESMRGNVTGVITEDGEELHFDKLYRDSTLGPNAPTMPGAWVREDTIYAYINGELNKIPLDVVQELQVGRLNIINVVGWAALLFVIGVGLFYEAPGLKFGGGGS